ncbi:hypothetical protein S40288_10374 [Stachybotrys chartarum IBT 40288]|nr:hypothetical protein S40288_10374 [Stachybotrys chartarum IBT 40288]
MPSSTTFLTALAASSLLFSSTSARICPPLGPVLPAPQSPSGSDAVQDAIRRLTAGLEAQTEALNASAVSIAVKSLHEDELLFNWHYTPPVLSGIGTDQIDENTIYRVGSVSKMMPVLLALQNASIGWDDSVLRYLPQLADGAQGTQDNGISWEDVTIGSLASHLSGLATDMAMDLAVFRTGPWTQMGLPELSNGTGPSCSGLPGTRPCTINDLVNNVNSRPPVYAPFTGPVYSNIAFGILGLVIEAATGESFEDVAKAQIFDTLGMDSTSFNGYVSSFNETGFVPVGEPTWNSTPGVFEAAGGLFSSTSDLIAFTEAILDNRLLSPAATREWMKPQAHTSSLGYSVGGPWEILRSDNLTSDGRVIDVYTKSGDLGLYHALIGIVVDYDIVISVLTAGPEVSMDPYARSKFFSGVVRSFVPALEEAGREEAATDESWVGTFTEEATNSSITITLDNGPGLLISNFTVRGFDVLNNINSYSINTASSSLDGSRPTPNIEGRLYPTKILSDSETAWRATFDSTTNEQRDELDAQLFNVDGSCDTWFGYDRMAYNYLSLAEFIYVQDDGAITAIRNPAFNVTLTKVSGGLGEADSSDGQDDSGQDGTGGPSDVVIEGVALSLRHRSTFVAAIGILLTTAVLF